MNFDKLNLKNILLSLAIVTSITSGYYFYLLVQNPIDKEINSIFSVYKNEGDVEYLQSNLNKISSKSEYENSDIISGIRQVCDNFESANSKLKTLNINYNSLLTERKNLISSNKSILTLCKEPKISFYAEINNHGLEDIVKATTSLKKMKNRKYKLKDTVADRYPVLSILVFMIILFLIFCLTKKPKEWASYSVKISAPLFVALTLLAIGLNPLYSLLILLLITYIGFLLIILSRKKSF